MLRLVRNLALGAALLTVAVAIWRDYGVLITLRRALTAYLVTFFLAGGLGLIAVVGLRVNQPPPPPLDEDERKKRRGRKGRQAREAAASVPPPADAPADAPPDAGEPPAPEPEPETTTVES